MARTFTKQFAETPGKQGARRIFGLVGDSLNPTVDAVCESSIEQVHVCNEEATASAVGAEPPVTDELAVCAAPCGPDSTHLIQGLCDSYRNGAKVLTLTSHIPSHQIGSSFFQETHPKFIFDECSGCCEIVGSVEQGGVVLCHAIQSAMTGHGVSVLVLSGDITTREVGNDELAISTVSSDHPVVFPDVGQVAALTDATNEAKTVTFFCGADVRDAHEQVLKLAEKIKSPMGHALGGRTHIQCDNPYDVGISDLLNYGAYYNALNDTDLLILFGTDLPYNDFPPTKSVTQVDIDNRAIGCRATVKYSAAGDVVATIEIILPYLDEETDRSFLDKQLRNHERLLNHVIEVYTHDVENMRSTHPEYVAGLIGEHANNDAVLTVDTGMGNV